MQVDFSLAAPYLYFHILECGVSNVTKIVNGSPVTPFSLPWQVGLLPYHATWMCCGGTLISTSHVLSAAHCMKPRSQLGCIPFEVIVGEHDVTKEEDGTPHEYYDIKRHPKYYQGAAFNYDFAIVFLTIPVVLGPRAVPACLPWPSMDGKTLTGKRLVVSGWGKLRQGGSQAAVLHSVIVPVITNKKCKKAYSSSRITEAMICAGYVKVGGVDSCQGDSGGKFFQNHPHFSFLVVLYPR